jgi:hypothetical protein
MSAITCPRRVFESAVRTIPARYWLGLTATPYRRDGLGLTATPYRRDGLDDLIGFQLGPARHTFEHADPDTFEGANTDQPRPVLVVHPTRFRIDDPDDLSIPGAIAAIHRALAEDDARNEKILAGKALVDQGRACARFRRPGQHPSGRPEALQGRTRQDAG